MTVGWKTLDVGEQALIFKLNGQARIETGPKRFFLFREKYVPLHCYHANQSSYLAIHRKDGKVVNKSGPCAMFLNPLEHKRIEVKEGIPLDANELLVIYRLEPKTNKVSRHLNHGPSLYIPDANEWLHEFSWHGTDPNNKTKKLPGLLKFTKMKVIPDQFYYNVDQVRTADDALMRVKLMLFYEFNNIEKMLFQLDATADPMADFINCMTADLIVFASKLTYMEFIEKSGELNDLDRYPQLLSRCKIIGASVSKVVFRGYHASPRLQKMHDGAIQARTKLKMEYEREEQEQQLTDINLQNEQSRGLVEQQIELKILAHNHDIERSEMEHKLMLWKQDELEKIQRMKKQEDANLISREQDNKQKLMHYNQLHTMGVDITEYLLSQNPQPHKVVKLIADDKAAVMHFHQN